MKFGRAGGGAAGTVFLLAVMAVRGLAQQSPVPGNATGALPNAPSTTALGSIAGTITDTDGAAIPAAQLVLENLETKASKNGVTDSTGVFVFDPVAAGKYRLRISAHGFSSWKVEDIVLQAGETKSLTAVELGVEAIRSDVDAITVEDLAERQITAEEHQRILGVLPNFYVSYVANPMPLTRKQKFKLAVVVSRDPLTFFTTGVTAAIEQAQDSFAGYGEGGGAYGERYAATYGDRLSSTFLGAALLPSLLHQDPRYFYKGTGSVVHRALYAMSTVVVCKGDNGHWQPNYSNVFGNLGSAGISTLYYPDSDRHGLQVTVTNSLIGIGSGAIGTVIQEFLLRHLTHGVPDRPAPQP